MLSNTSSGSLTVVGTGIQLIGQATIEAKAHIEQADKVLFLVADPATTHWIQKLNSTAESLHGFYGQNKDRLTTYKEMTEQILSFVRQGFNVCAVFYGHPGVFVYPSHEAVRQARLEGFDARMLPGISAEDCLFSDLGVDPASTGCQSFEATDFLVYQRKFDPHSSLILWQIGVIGDLEYKQRYDLQGLRILIEFLQESYPLSHQVIVYQAAQYPICEPIVEIVTLEKLPNARITPISTLYVPPLEQQTANIAMLERLGIPLSEARERKEAAFAHQPLVLHQ
jgi:uncharacterized protein YabN with tetrapyrrole methylase and pyrophosphatase domain